MSNPATETPKVTVVSTIDLPSSDPARLGKMDLLVTYRVDALHTFTVKIPAENMTPQKFDAAIKSDYAERKVYINRQISV
jgi:hypothetical protein